MQALRSLGVGALVTVLAGVAACHLDAIFRAPEGGIVASLPLGARLAFTTAPTGVAAGQPITPTVAVSAEDSLGAVITSFADSVSIALGAGAGGTLTGTLTVLASQGVARFSDLRLHKAGPGYTLTAGSTRVGSVTSSAFAVAPGAATQIAVSAGSSQAATVGTAVATPPAVLVRDQFLNAVAGVGVTFAVASGGGSVSPTTPVITNGNGIAAATSWTLGPAVGTNTLTATATGLTGSPLAFNATGTAGTPSASQSLVAATPGTITASSGSNQATITVTVKDASGNPVSGATVSLAATGTGNTITQPNGPANASGQVTGMLSATRAGAKSVSATINGTITVTQTASVTVTPGSASQIAVALGNNQTATVNTAVTTAPAVSVADSFGNPVAGVNVTFAVASGGGSVSPTNPFATNASGIAAVTAWTLGTKAGSNTLTATAAGLTGSPVTFAATSTAGPAVQVVMSVGNNQTATVGTAVGIAPAVSVTDQFGNPVAGFGVTFAVTGGGGTVSPTSAVPTGANGIAAATTWTLGTAAGTNTLSATATGLAGNPVSFTATATAGPAAQIAVNAGDNQTAAGGTAVSIPPSVIVTDRYGNPVAGVAVTFRVASGGGSVNPTTPVTTDAAGVAAVTSWTLGLVPGTNTLTATAAASGVTGNPVTFTATGI